MRGEFGSPSPRRLAHLTRPSWVWCLLMGASPYFSFPRRCRSSLVAFTVGTNGLERGFSRSCIVNAIGCAACRSSYTSFVPLALAAPRGPLPSLRFFKAWSRPGREVAGKWVCVFIILQINTDLSIEVARRIRNAWCSFRKYNLKLYDRPNAPLELKIRMLRAEILETMLYGCVT